jgi:Zn-dependent M16 (insulinase) family peptidase
VRRYHGSYYKSENLVVIIVGHLSSYDALFQSLAPIDKELKSDSRDAFARPWSSNPDVFPVIKTSKVETILFPEEDESIGTFKIGWHGPKITASTVLLF